MFPKSEISTDQTQTVRSGGGYSSLDIFIKCNERFDTIDSFHPRGFENLAFLQC